MGGKERDLIFACSRFARKHIARARARNKIRLLFTHPYNLPPYSVRLVAGVRVVAATLRGARCVPPRRRCRSDKRDVARVALFPN